MRRFFRWSPQGHANRHSSTLAIRARADFQRPTELTDPFSHSKQSDPSSGTGFHLQVLLRWHTSTLIRHLYTHFIRSVPTPDSGNLAACVAVQIAATFLEDPNSAWFHLLR